MIKRGAFTLIEVMVAVMIISVVIAAIIQMRGNSSNMFMHLQKQAAFNQYASFLLWNDKYGFVDEKVPLSRLVEDIDIDDDLRRKLKNIKMQIEYKKLRKIDTSEYSDDATGIVIEMGIDKISTKNFETTLRRLRLQ